MKMMARRVSILVGLFFCLVKIYATDAAAQQIRDNGEGMVPAQVLCRPKVP